MVEENDQARARLRGSGGGKREGGALSAVHGAGKNSASFHCTQTELRCKEGEEKPTIHAAENFFFSPRMWKICMWVYDLYKTLGKFSISQPVLFGRKQCYLVIYRMVSSLKCAVFSK